MPKYEDTTTIRLDMQGQPRLVPTERDVDAAQRAKGISHSLSDDTPRLAPHSGIPGLLRVWLAPLVSVSCAFVLGFICAAVLIDALPVLAPDSRQNAITSNSTAIPTMTVFSTVLAPSDAIADPPMMLQCKDGTLWPVYRASQLVYYVKNGWLVNSCYVVQWWDTYTDNVFKSLISR